MLVCERKKPHTMTSSTTEDMNTSRGVSEIANELYLECTNWLSKLFTLVHIRK